MSDQVGLFEPSAPERIADGWVSGRWWGAGALRPDGFHHVARAADDPERRTRKQRRDELGRHTAVHGWRQLAKEPREAWAARIREHLADGEPRTFNRIMVELADTTADIAYMTPADAGLWELVAGGEVEHTARIPLLFRRITE